MSCECTVSVEFGTATLSSHTKVSIKLPCPMATPCSAQRNMPLPCITICATPTVSQPLVPGFTNALLETVPCTYATVEMAGQGGSSPATADMVLNKSKVRAAEGTRVFLMGWF